MSISYPTVQSILSKHGLATRYDRQLKLGEKNAAGAIHLTGEQVAFMEKQHAAFKERHVESSQPGELLCQDTFLVGTIKAWGGSIFMLWWTPSAVMPSAFFILPSSRKTPWQCCTTRFYLFTGQKIYRCGPS